MNGVDLLGLRGVKVTGIEERPDGVFVDAEEEDRGVAIALANLVGQRARRSWKPLGI